MSRGRLSRRLLPAFLLAAAAGLVVHGCSKSGGGGGAAATAAASTATPGPAPVTSGSTAPAASAAPAQPAQPATPAPPARTTTAVVVDRYGEGYLEVDGGRKILHTKGTSFERGFQYGYLVGDEVEGVLRKLPRYVTQQGNTLAAYAQSMLTPVGAAVFRNYFDADALEEIRGIVAGMRARNPGTFVTEQDLVFVNSLVDIGAVVGLNVFQCSGLAVWGDLTPGGKVYQTRNVDLMVGSGIEDHTLVVIAKPEGGVAYANPGWAGMIGCASGLNAHGIGVSQVWAFSTEKGLGRPWILSMRELMATGTNVDDGVRILQNDRRTYGSNFVLADRGDGRGGVPRGVSIEVTQRRMAVFEADDPREDLAVWNGNIYSFRLPYAVFRGDVALDPTIRSLQTASNGPTGDPRAAGAYRDRYEGQFRGIDRYRQAGQKIGKDECIQISRDVAMRRDSLQCVVYENTDLELHVANARIVNGQAVFAYAEPYHHTSLDFYTPTASVIPDRTLAAIGETLQVAVPLSTLGRARSLDVRLTLRLGASTVGLGPKAATTLVLPERGAQTVLLEAEIPATIPNVGHAQLTCEVYEAGTQHLVDVSIVDVTITP